MASNYVNANNSNTSEKMKGPNSCMTGLGTNAPPEAFIKLPNKVLTTISFPY